MKFLEKDLEQIIYESDKSQLRARGLCTLDGKMYRQLRIGNYGVADLVTIQRPYFNDHFGEHQKGIISIYELKQQTISVSAFFQSLRYARGIQRYLLEKYHKYSDVFNFKLVLIGSEYSGDVVYLGDLFNVDLCDNSINSEFKTSVELYSYEYSIDGIKFSELSGYKLTNEGF